MKIILIIIGIIILGAIGYYIWKAFYAPCPKTLNCMPPRSCEVPKRCEGITTEFVY